MILCPYCKGSGWRPDKRSWWKRLLESNKYICNLCLGRKVVTIADAKWFEEEFRPTHEED